MSDSKSSESGFDLEQFINLLAQRLFPRWYARHAVKEIELADIEGINPESYLCHRWLSIISVHEAAAESLLSTHQKWHPLAELLKKTLIENEYPRKLSITAIKGVKVSQCDEDYPDILSYAQQQADQIPHETEADFSNNVAQAFTSLLPLTSVPRLGPTPSPPTTSTPTSVPTASQRSPQIWSGLTRWMTTMTSSLIALGVPCCS